MVVIAKKVPGGANLPMFKDMQSSSNFELLQAWESQNLVVINVFCHSVRKQMNFVQIVSFLKFYICTYPIEIWWNSAASFAVSIHIKHILTSVFLQSANQTVCLMTIICILV